MLGCLNSQFAKSARVLMTFAHILRWYFRGQWSVGRPAWVLKSRSFWLLFGKRLINFVACVCSGLFVQMTTISFASQFLWSSFLSCRFESPKKYFGPTKCISAPCFSSSSSISFSSVFVCPLSPHHGYSLFLASCATILRHFQSYLDWKLWVTRAFRAPLLSVHM